MHERLDIDFNSKGTTCRAWFYPAQNMTLRSPAGVPCVVMAHGFGGTRDAGLEPYAEKFAAAGLAVFLFDYRHFGASDGEPRQLFSVRRQLQDWSAAIHAARQQSWIDETRIALWGSSFSGGHVITAAARDRRVAAVTAQGPMMDGLAAVVNVVRTAGLMQWARLALAGLRDTLADVAGADPYYIPIVAPPGTPAVMSTADAFDGFHAITPPDWRNEVTARSTLTLAFYRPGRRARQLPCPALVQICDDDSVAPVYSAEAAVQRAGGRVAERHYHIGHFDIYRGAGFRQASSDQLDFLRRHLLPAQATDTHVRGKQYDGTGPQIRRR